MSHNKIKHFCSGVEQVHTCNRHRDPESDSAVLELPASSMASWRCLDSWYVPLDLPERYNFLVCFLLSFLVVGLLAIAVDHFSFDKYHSTKNRPRVP